VAVRELLLHARTAGKTIFLSSHLLSEVELICDRVAVLHQGKLLRLGKTSDLLQSSEQTEIVARGIAASAVVGAQARNGVVSVTGPTAAQRSSLEQIWNAGGEVVSVNPVRRSLEQLFLDLIGNPASAEGAPKQ